MHIDEGKDTIILGRNLPHISIWVSDILNQFLDSADGWMQFLIWCMILSIEVISSHVGSIVTYNDTVRVDHWDDLENTSLP